MAIKIVQDIDVDGVTIQIKEADGQPKLVAQGSANPSAQDKDTVEFGDREVTIGDFFINGGGMVKLVFRELIANSNRMAVCTGFEFNGNWYLDRPDDGDVIDVFNNMEVKEVKNNIVVTKSAPPLQPVTPPVDTQPQPAVVPFEFGGFVPPTDLATGMINIGINKIGTVLFENGGDMGQGDFQISVQTDSGTYDYAVAYDRLSQQFIEISGFDAGTSFVSGSATDETSTTDFALMLMSGEAITSVTVIDPTGQSHTYP